MGDPEERRVEEQPLVRMLAPAFKPAAVLIAALVASLGFLVGGMSMFDSMLNSRIERAVEGSPQASMGAKLQLVGIQQKATAQDSALQSLDERLTRLEKSQVEVLQRVSAIGEQIKANGEVMAATQQDVRELLRAQRAAPRR